MRKRKIKTWEIIIDFICVIGVSSFAGIGYIQLFTLTPIQEILIATMLSSAVTILMTSLISLAYKEILKGENDL